jgi:hypothetical protein
MTRLQGEGLTGLAVAPGGVLSGPAGDAGKLRRADATVTAKAPPAPATPAPATPAPGTPAPGTPAPGTPAPGTPAPGTPPKG